MMELYDWQREAIDALIDGPQRVLVVAPTGGGKSLCYQQPAVDLPGVALVITPLVALMADQVAALTARGVPATYLAANLDPEENRRRIEMTLAGKVKLLYIAPERLASQQFVEEVVQRLPLSLLAIDEAHCISQWGHDFRPEYLQIGDFVERLRPPRLLACTATATPLVRREILERLHMPDAHQVLRGFARHNLRLAVEEVSGPKMKEKRIAEEVKRVLTKPQTGAGSALVYTASRRNSENVATMLRGLGWRAEHYHAGMSGPERTRVQEKFQAGGLDVVAATNAFGMGIDRSDIRLVVHHSMPESVEAYYQEVGRAGRDREPAHGLLLIADPDIAWRFRMIANDTAVSPELGLRRREMLRAMVGYAETSACRHDSILAYFEDEAEELGGCSQCDNCVATAEGRLEAEPDEEASKGVVREALSAIRKLPFAVGAGAIAAYLVGSGSAQIRKYDWQSRPQYGAMRDRREDWVRRLLRRFVATGLLAVDPENQTLRITKRTVDVINEARPNPVRLPPSERSTLRAGTRNPRSDASMLPGEAAILFDLLKQWRRLRADGDGVPAYVICHDATLAGIAEARPLSGEALVQINGMGGTKVSRYGVQILAVVRAHVEEHPEQAVRAVAAAPEAVDDGPLSLYDQLRAWRRRRAVADGVKLWFVCSNEALQAVADARPPSIEALMSLGCMEPEKMQRYAPELLAVIGAYGAGDSEPDAASPNETAPTDEPPEVTPAQNGIPPELTRNWSDYQLQVRATHARAWERWSDDEDARVVELAAAGKNADAIAADLERQPGAVAMRMEKLGLIAPAEAAP